MNGISAETLLSLHRIVGRRSGEQAAALTAIGLLCASGVGLRAIIRDLPNLIRRVIEVDTVGFFWSDPDGRLIDAYVEEPYFLSAEVLLSCERYQQETPSNWPTFTENVLAGPVVGYLVPYQTSAFYTSHHYAFTYERIGARHVLDAVVHDGAPLGCYLFMRGRDQGCFTQEEMDIARSIAALTGIALRDCGSASTSTRSYHAGLIVFDRDDQIIFRNLPALQSLWMLGHSEHTPVHAAPEGSFDVSAGRFCRDVVEETRREGALRREVSNWWGDFVIECELDQSGSVAVRFHQKRPLAAHLAMELVNLNLPPRRMTVCWLALMGLSRKEIARLTNLSVDTIGEHFDALFNQLRVSTVQGLTARFLA